MSDPPSRSSEEIEREMRQRGLGYERPLQVTLAEAQAQKQNRTGDKNVGRKPSSTHHHNSLTQEKDTMTAAHQTHETPASKHEASNSAQDPIAAALEAKRILQDNFSMKRELLRASMTAGMTVALGAAVFGVVAFFTKPVAIIPEAVPLKK